MTPRFLAAVPAGSADRSSLRAPGFALMVGSGAVLESPAFVAGLDDLAVMGEAIEERRSHLGVAEDGWPFAECQVRRDDDRSALVELADEMEQELAAGLGEWQIAQLVEDQKVEAGEQVGGPALPLGAGFGVELVHQVDDVEEPPAAAVANAGPGDADGEMGLAGSGPADEDEVALMIEEVPGGEVADEGLVNLGRLEVELFQFLGQRQLGDRHLVFDRAGLLLGDLCGQQVTDDLLGFVLAFDRGGDDLVIGRPHAVELQLPHGVQHLRSFHSLFSSGCHTGRNRRRAHGPASAHPAW